jgi:aquaporin Z
MSLWKRSLAEFGGTFWLVFCGCGAAVVAATGPAESIGFTGVALAFGLALLTMAYALGPISGAHFNPAISVGLWASGRFPALEVPVYVAAQVAGGLVAGGVLHAIASGAPAFDPTAGFASNGYGAHSPGHYSLAAAAACEAVLTGGFLLVIMGVTDPRRGLSAFAPLAIGLALALIHLVSIPVTNTSVNPARSTGVALYAGGWAIRQLWLFWVAPIAGGVLGALAYRALFEARTPQPAEGERLPRGARAGEAGSR